MVGLLVAVGALAYISLNKVNHSADIIYDNGVIINRQLDKIEATIFQMRGDYYKYMIVSRRKR